MSDIEALLRERAGYVARGLHDRVAQVNAQLVAAGHQPIDTIIDDNDNKVQTTARRGRPSKAG